MNFNITAKELRGFELGEYEWYTEQDETYRIVKFYKDHYEIGASANEIENFMYMFCDNPIMVYDDIPEFISNDDILSRILKESPSIVAVAIYKTDGTCIEKKEIIVDNGRTKNMKNSGTKEINTKDLKLRKFVMEDAEMMYNNWATDKETVKHLEWEVHKDLNETKEYVAHILSKYERQNAYTWCIEEKKSNQAIGSISVFNIDYVNKTCEVGYAIGSKWHGLGYGTQMLTAVLDYLKAEGFYMILSNCSSENPASKRIMEKCNMTLDAVLKNRLTSRFDKNNDRADIYCFSY